MTEIAAPPPQKRVDALDVIRGVAILGILIANIASFATPIFAEELGPQIGIPYVPSRSLHDALLTAFVAGKFRGMLAILFGIGLMLQFQRRNSAGEPWPGTYVRRSIFLLLLGLFHALFIWYGDILLPYAMTALIMMWFAKSSDLTLKWIVGVGLAYGFFFALVTALASMLQGSASPDAAASMMKGLLDQAPLLKIWFTPQGETWVYQQAGYDMQLLHRLGIAAIGLFNHILLLPYFGGLFAVGMLIARSRVWDDPERLNRALQRGMLIGLGIGLPLNVATIPLTLRGKGDVASAVVEVFLSAFLCVGYLCLLGWLATRLPSLMKPFGLVGRTALTCYLLTSVLATTAYYSWGFALYGRTTRLQDWAIITAIWIFLLIFAFLWTSRFEYGPVEWAWRSASLKRKLVLRRPK